MRVFQQKRKFRRTLYSLPVLLLFFLLAIFSIQGAWSVYHKQVASSVGLKETNIEWGKLTEREEVLQVEIERLQTGRGLEEEIREKFSVGKEGEKVAVIVGATVGSQEKVPTGLNALWQTMWNFMTGRR